MTDFEITTTENHYEYDIHDGFVSVKDADETLHTIKFREGKNCWKINEEEGWFVIEDVRVYEIIFKDYYAAKDDKHKVYAKKIIATDKDACKVESIRRVAVDHSRFIRDIAAVKL